MTNKQETCNRTEGSISYADDANKTFSRRESPDREFIDEDKMDNEPSLSWMDGHTGLLDLHNMPFEGSLNFSFLAYSEAITQVKVAPVVQQQSYSRVGTRRTRFADVIAIDFEPTLPTHSNMDIFDTTDNEQSFGNTSMVTDNEQSFGNTSMASLDFLSSQERAVPFGNNSATFDYDRSLHSFTEEGEDHDDSSQMKQDAQGEEAKNEGRQMMYAVGGAGLFALVGWAVRKLSRTVEEEDEDRDAAGVIRENIGGRDQTADVNQAEIVNSDGGSFNLETSGNMSKSGMSQSGISQSQVATGGGWGGAGGGQAAVNPALQL